MGYKVQLASAGNPDMGQAAGRALPGVRGRWVRVDTFEAASKVCRDFITANGLGGGNWSGGKIVDDRGAHVADVSFNGAVWPPGGFRLGAEPLWSPNGSPRKIGQSRFEFDEAKIETPEFGFVTVTGCTRTGLVRSVPRRFAVGDVAVEFVTDVWFDGKGGAKMIRDRLSLHPDGRMDIPSVPVSNALWDALTGAVKEFAASREGMRLVVGNDLKDVSNADAVCGRSIEYHETEIAKQREEMAKNGKALKTLEARLAELDAEPESGMAP